MSTDLLSFFPHEILRGMQGSVVDQWNRSYMVGHVFFRLICSTDIIMSLRFDSKHTLQSLENTIHALSDALFN